MSFKKELMVKASGVAVYMMTASQLGFAESCDPTTGTIAEGAECARPKGARGDLFAQGGIFSTIATTLIFLVGAISVIMLIIGGLRYVFSQGEAAAVKGAKDTILYAIIGIIVAILAFAAVQFVISRFAGGPTA